MQCYNSSAIAIATISLALTQCSAPLSNVGVPADEEAVSDSLFFASIPSSSGLLVGGGGRFCCSSFAVGGAGDDDTVIGSTGDGGEVTGVSDGGGGDTTPPVGSARRVGAGEVGMTVFSAVVGANTYSRDWRDNGNTPEYSGEGSVIRI